MIGSFWLLISIVLLIISIATKQVPLLLVTLLFFLTGGIARIWSRYCLDRIEYRRTLSSPRVFFGEAVKMDIEVSNRKPLPLPWLQVEDEIPNELTLSQEPVFNRFDFTYQTLNNLFAVSWYQKITRHYTMQCNRRGYFEFGDTILSSGDIFGFFKKYKHINVKNNLMVYPKMVPLNKLGIPSRQPLGEIRTRNHLFHDPVLTMGIREYQYGDSLKSIHWKSTARTGKMQTKIYEPTTTVDFSIFLDGRTMQLAAQGVDAQKLELAIVTAASMAQEALTEGYRVGLYVNQNTPDSAELVRIPPNRQSDQLKHILEALAKLRPGYTLPMTDMLVQDSKNLPWGSTLVVITAVPAEQLLSVLLRMKRAGRKVVLITIGGEELPAGAHSLTHYHVSEDIPWEKLESLTIGIKS